MASFDYAPLVADAQALIAEFGRSVTFVAFDTTAADPAMPWNGPTDPRGTPSASLAASAVFVEPASASKLGLNTTDNDMVKRSEQIMMVAPGASADMSVYQEVVDSDSSRWKIEGISVLKPADTVVLAFVGVRR